MTRAEHGRRYWESLKLNFQVDPASGDRKGAVVWGGTTSH